MAMKYKVWLAFGALGLIWGTSFLWIKIAVSEAGPFTVVGLRILFGLLGLLVVIAVQRPALPRDRRVLLAFVFLGIFNTGLPFVLITWGETGIPSSVAAILDATVPLFTIIIAHFWLHDEKITAPRLGGLLAGFAGIVVLVSGNLNLSNLSANVWGQLAVVGASISYAIAITFARRNLRNQPPVMQTALMLLIADSLVWATAFGAGQPFAPPHSALAWFALLWLGLLGTCVAYLLYFYIINAWGPTRASLVTYVFPVVGLVLGILFLHESADWRLLVGSALIVGGIGIVNLRTGQPRLVPQAAAAD
jgi:drug/metabolite transporter (DMT)-like permease